SSGDSSSRSYAGGGKTPPPRTGCGTIRPRSARGGHLGHDAGRLQHTVTRTEGVLAVAFVHESDPALVGVGLDPDHVGAEAALGLAHRTYSFPRPTISPLSMSSSSRRGPSVRIDSKPSATMSQ